METKYDLVNNFITKNEREQIINWVGNLKNTPKDSNSFIVKLAEDLNGENFVFDISKTPETNYIVNFQSKNKPLDSLLPNVIYDIIDRIAEFKHISKDNIYLQVVDMKKGGKITPHYDAALNGYINYKCNISVLSEDYYFFIDKEKIKIKIGDLYCFEASLYKHWTDEFLSRRIFLSIGFILPYSELGRLKDEPRIRLSERIQKYFQKI